MKKIYYSIFLISLMLNIVLALVIKDLHTKNNNKEKNIKYCKNYLEKLKYKEHTNYNTATTKSPIITKYYEINTLDESDYKKAIKCYDNLNIKIN